MAENIWQGRQNFSMEYFDALYYYHFQSNKIWNQLKIHSKKQLKVTIYDYENITEISQDVIAHGSDLNNWNSLDTFSPILISGDIVSI